MANKLTEKEVRDALEKSKGSGDIANAVLNNNYVKDEVIYRLKKAGLIKEQKYIVEIPDWKDRPLSWQDGYGWQAFKKDTTHFTMDEIKAHPFLKDFVKFAKPVEEAEG